MRTDLLGPQQLSKLKKNGKNVRFHKRCTLHSESEQGCRGRGLFLVGKTFTYLVASIAGPNGHNIYRVPILYARV